MHYIFANNNINVNLNNLFSVKRFMLFPSLDNLLFFIFIFVCIILCKDEFNDTKIQLKKLKDIQMNNMNRNL